MLVNSSKRQTANVGETVLPANRDGLEQVLRSAVATERRRAAHALRDYADAVPALCRRLGDEPEAAVRAAILNSLIHLRSIAVVRELVAYLRSENAALRNEVIEALQEMPDEALPVLDDLLADNDSDVRIFAVNILSVLPYPRTSRVLERVITSDPHVNVCMAALDGLMEAGDSTMRQAVSELPLRFPDLPFVRFAASMTLKRIEGAS